MAREQRIKDLSMTLNDTCFVMSEGNPGALRVLCELLSKGGDIDPDSAMGGFANILNLDSLGIYESRIWKLYKDVCGEYIPKVVLVLRGWQLGCILDSQINEAIDHGAEIDFRLLTQKVKANLPNFNIALKDI